MIGKEEYSVLAAAAYNDTRGEFNKIGVTPLGWTTIASQSDTTGGLQEPKENQRGQSHLTF